MCKTKSNKLEKFSLKQITILKKNNNTKKLTFAQYRFDKISEYKSLLYTHTSHKLITNYLDSKVARSMYFLSVLSIFSQGFLS